MLRDRAIASSHREKGYEFRHEWRDWDQISLYAALAVVAAEDQQFPAAQRLRLQADRQGAADRERGRRVRGASTISQQVAKNLFLWPGQSWFRKGLEAGITVLIELAWTKQRILEVHLNVAEFGRGTWGIQAASRRFFRKDAARLTRAEAALLAAVLPSPRTLPRRRAVAYVRKRQAWIQRQMVALGGKTYSRTSTETSPRGRAIMTTTTRIAIIGAGHSGICMGMQLKRAGIDDFVILEKAAALGGTWRDNTYPGASCDAPSFLYSFSFAQKTDWSRRFAWQSELLGYSVECAIQSGLLPHMRFRAEVTTARYDETHAVWRIELANGESIEAQFLVTGVGQLHRPAIPALPGRESFGGVQFHSARWDHRWTSPASAWP